MTKKSPPMPPGRGGAGASGPSPSEAVASTTAQNAPVTYVERAAEGYARSRCLTYLGFSGPRVREGEVRERIASYRTRMAEPGLARVKTALRTVGIMAPLDEAMKAAFTAPGYDGVEVFEGMTLGQWLAERKAIDAAGDKP